MILRLMLLRKTFDYFIHKRIIKFAILLYYIGLFIFKLRWALVSFRKSKNQIIKNSINAMFQIYLYIILSVLLDYSDYFRYSELFFKFSDYPILVYQIILINQLRSCYFFYE